MLSDAITLDPAAPPVRAPIAGWLARWRAFLIVVIAPTLLAAVYYGLIAAPQYESEAHVMVRSNSPSTVPTGLGQALSVAVGTSGAQNEAHSIGDYLRSHDAVEALRERAALVERLRRPEADPLSRLRDPDPTPEALLKAYRRQVDVGYDPETMITTIRVRFFRPDDSYAIIRALLQLGEARVNDLNVRAYEAQISAARGQLAAAETAVRQAQGRLTGFRQQRRDIDPQGSGETQLRLVSELSGQLAVARARLDSMGATIRHDSPQYQALAAQVRSLAAQVGAERARLTSGEGSIASGLGNYQELELRSQFAAKQFEAAAAALEKARDQAQQQQLFVVRVVEPNLPVKALYPKSLKIVATVFAVLAMAYILGWLMLAGLREHAA